MFLSGARYTISPLRYQRTLVPGPSAITNASSDKSDRPQYPFARLRPVIHSSPGSPSGTKSPDGVLIDNCTPVIGRPIGTPLVCLAGFVGTVKVQQPTVASVGP